ncbi:hypothetical protein RvY_03779 [Ramazzottius varieornatus]|uniref:Uncharacterized protein n=1 Tax=Ramazzottius varieornatus TaxID=947166 RepID=A0A1D1UWD1_RAMVA|nr:hypothetical protein RvY_03779 [Ramazzottius varieornatus]
MAAQKHLLIVLLVAATGADAARFPSRFSMRTNHRQVVPGNGDQSSGSGFLNSADSSVTSAGS